MNNIMATKTDFIISKDAISFIKDGGKYGYIALGALGMYLLHDLFIQAMERDYAFNVNFNPEGKVDFNFTPSTVIKE